MVVIIPDCLLNIPRTGKIDWKTESYLYSWSFFLPEQYLFSHGFLIVYPASVKLQIAVAIWVGCTAQACQSLIEKYFTDFLCLNCNDQNNEKPDHCQSLMVKEKGPRVNSGQPLTH